MTNNARFAEVAALAGDPGRAAMLHALMDGRALTASELARVARVSPQTASGHLARMTAAGLLAANQQGRHRYHRIATPGVAQMMESIMQVAAKPDDVRRLMTGPRDAALRAARTCYNHLAGRLGVALADAMVSERFIELESDAGLVTKAGLSFLTKVGIDSEGLTSRGRVLCKPCLDWSERRFHLAGTVGSALCAHSLAAGWVRRIDGTRAVAITPKGERVFREQFRMRLDA